jgi:hypothetical protein
MYIDGLLLPDVLSALPTESKVVVMPFIPITCLYCVTTEPPYHEAPSHNTSVILIGSRL